MVKQMNYKELADAYLTKVDQGAKACNQEDSIEFRRKRAELIKYYEKYKVVLAPHSASFYVDVGGGFKEFYGECQRKAFLDYHKSNIIYDETGIAIRRMTFGKLAEEQEHKYEEKAGILVASNFRMSKEITPEVILSCEVDSVVKLETETVLIEHKSYDGYQAKKEVQGSKDTPGMPKYEHIAQGMFYLAITPDHYSDVSKLLYHYRTRAELYPTIHVMELDLIKNDKGVIIDGYPIINGTKYTFTSLRQLLLRGVELTNFIIKKKLPPREPEYCYSEEKIRHLFSLGSISKTKFADWQKGERIGDWQCDAKYCPFFRACRGDRPGMNEPNDDEVLSNVNTKTVLKSDDLDTSLW
jgi:hypothetical protein